MRSLKGERKNSEISFLGRIFLFFKSLFERIKDLQLFRKIVDHEKAVAGADTKDSPAEAKISFVLGMSRLFAIVLLVVFLITVIVFGGKTIAYDNVYYMFRDIAYINSFTES